MGIVLTFIHEEEDLPQGSVVVPANELSFYWGLEFCCPGCNTPFAMMSGVLQHVESGFCGNPGGKTALDSFLRFLRRKIRACL